MFKTYLLHWALGGGLTIGLSAAARALPEPTPGESRFYLWFYRFCQNLLANFDKSKATK